MLPMPPARFDFIHKSQTQTADLRLPAQLAQHSFLRPQPNFLVKDQLAPFHCLYQRTWTTGTGDNQTVKYRIRDCVL